jgi:hypothetical protein
MAVKITRTGSSLDVLFEGVSTGDVVTLYNALEEYSRHHDFAKALMADLKAAYDRANETLVWPRKT